MSKKEVACHVFVWLLLPAGLGLAMWWFIWSMPTFGRP